MVVNGLILAVSTFCNPMPVRLTVLGAPKGIRPAITEFTVFGK